MGLHVHSKGPINSKLDTPWECLLRFSLSVVLKRNQRKATGLQSKGVADICLKPAPNRGLTQLEGGSGREGAGRFQRAPVRDNVNPHESPSTYS